MVSLALGQPNDARLEVAAQLAERFGARVTGIAAAEFSPPLYFMEGEPAQEADRSRVDRGQEPTERPSRGEFRVAMQNRAVETEWRCGEEFPTRFVVRQARALRYHRGRGSRPRPRLADPFMQVGPSDLVLQVGRPFAGCPRDLQLAGLRSVLVAWKDTAESRRRSAGCPAIAWSAQQLPVVEIVENEAGCAAALAAGLATSLHGCRDTV